MTFFGSMRAALVFSAAAAALAGGAARAASPAADELAAQSAWRADIARLKAPGAGCFAATYPERAWHEAACRAAPATRYLPRNAARGVGRTVGNGNDYAALTSTLTQSATGSFPVATGITKETGLGGANVYSLQLNSGFMNTAGCNGGASGCLTWEQFVYSSSSQAAFMQYWLINYGKKCPKGGWMSFQGSCYRNSNAVGVPQIPAASLGTVSVTGDAVKGGLDTLTVTYGTKAYKTTGDDSVVYLANAWNASEYNVVGDGGGSAAKFNKGTTITVNIALTDGSTAAPVCQGNDGTTGETNNLTAGTCTASGGSTPSVSFTEKH